MTQAHTPASGRVSPTVVTLPAEIDMTNADRVGADLRAALATGVTTVVADMTATTFCDSAAIRALVLAHKHAEASGAELRLVVPSACVLRVMSVLGLDALLSIYPGLPEALAVQPQVGGAVPRRSRG
jgi:anti-sigma B factor antagonist